MSRVVARRGSGWLLTEVGLDVGQADREEGEGPGADPPGVGEVEAVLVDGDLVDGEEDEEYKIKTYFFWSFFCAIMLELHTSLRSWMTYKSRVKAGANIHT